MRSSLAVPFALLIAAPTAEGAEGESALSVTPSFATFALTQADGGDTVQIDATGGNLLVEYERGLSDTLWLRGAAGGGLYSVDGELGWSGSASAGITYAIDVLKYVPYFNLGAGAMYVGGGPIDAGFKAYLELGFGLDILRSRSFSYGVVFRFDSFVSDVSYFTAGGRVTWRWGWF